MGNSPAEIGGKAPLVSVILPVCNGGRTIYSAVMSILNQTFTDYELIVVNDGSTDNTLTVLSRIKDARLRIVSDGMNKGLAARLNEAVVLAQGAYIARMDADDLAFPERLQKQITFLDTHADVDLVATRAIVFSEVGSVIGLLPYRGTHEALTASLWRGIPMPHPTWMGRRRWFLNNPYRSLEVLRAEDQELLLRVAGVSKYACLPDVLLGYRQGPYNVSKTLVARRHLLAAQIRIFGQRREYQNIVRAVLWTAAKVLVDFCAALPFGDTLFFMRMKTQVVPKQAVVILRGLLGQPAGERRG